MKTILIVIALAALVACNREGPVEKAGRQVDKAVDKAGRSIEKAGDAIRDAAKGNK